MNILRHENYLLYSTHMYSSLHAGKSKKRVGNHVEKDAESSKSIIINENLKLMETVTL